MLWLNERDLDIRCIRVRPYTWQQKVLLDVQQVLPLPEASDYQVKVKEKAVEKRAAERKFNFDFFGSPQEFVRSGILRGFPGFLKSDVFGVGHGHALGLQ